MARSSLEASLRVGDISCSPRQTPHVPVAGLRDEAGAPSRTVYLRPLAGTCAEEAGLPRLFPTRSRGAYVRQAA